MREPKTLVEIREIEQQLSCPNGKHGIEVAEQMHESNIGMILKTIQTLDITDDESILELGHGSCRHLYEVLGAAKSIRYFGLEISETMRKEAERFSRIIGEDAMFSLFDGRIIPYENDLFDRIMTVNTIYFWQDPKQLVEEISRVLRVGGTFVLTFAEKEFMSTLPFVGDKFKLYGPTDIENLIQDSCLEIEKVFSYTERVKNKLNKTINRKYHVVKMTCV